MSTNIWYQRYMYSKYIYSNYIYCIWRSSKYIYSNPFLGFQFLPWACLMSLSQKSWEGALAKYVADNRISTRQNRNITFNTTVSPSRYLLLFLNNFKTTANLLGKRVMSAFINVVWQRWRQWWFKNSNWAMLIGQRWWDNDDVMTMGGEQHTECLQVLRHPSKATIN